MGDDVEDADEWIAIFKHFLSLLVINVLAVLEEF